MEPGEGRFRAAVAAFARANGEDPNRLLVEGAWHPREQVDAERLATWVARVAPEASEALRLAAHCQHLRRWEIPRARYPEGKAGYHAWRAALMAFHAEQAALVLASVGYEPALIERVRRIVCKRGLATDPEVQAMEDALCLAFLEHELEEFASKHAPEKVVNILRKTWRKMSPRGQALARQLTLPESVRPLLDQALDGGADPQPR